jgi:carboxylesterase
MFIIIIISEVFFLNDMNCELAKEFYFKGNSTGILLIHGFTGTPSEVRFIGEFLRDKGYTVMGILLKGHGTTPEDMKKCGYRDWIRGAVEGYKSLKQECDEVFAVGLSMGGLLSLYLARNYDVRGVATLSAPIRIHGRLAAFSFIERHFKTYILRNPEKKNINVISYDKSPIISVHNLFKLIRYVKANLKYIEKPVLVMQSYGDRTVSPMSANIIYNNIGSKDKSIIYLRNSGHVITCDKEKEQVFEEVYSFIKNKSAFKRETDNKEERCSSVG